jgi:hypothetical protein
MYHEFHLILNYLMSLKNQLIQLIQLFLMSLQNLQSQKCQ